jgi:phosphohistidine phosphatase
VRLYLVRHAEAAPGEPDELRALTPEGRAQAKALGEQLAADGVQVDALLTSPLLRARETGDELATALDATSEPDNRLAPGTTLERVREAVSGRGDSVLIVCHQPDCGQIAAAITGTEPGRVAPASVLTLDLD